MEAAGSGSIQNVVMLRRSDRPDGEWDPPCPEHDLGLQLTSLSVV